MICKHFRPFFLFLLFFSFIACSACPAPKDPPEERHELVLEGSGEKVVIKAEIARTDEERAQGLMFRESLADGEGMLFVFEKDEVLSFWMKNTLIPLSIAFIASDGRITEIRDMEPGNLNPVRSSRSVRYALEVPLGWFDRVNLGAGGRLIVDGL